METPPSTPEVAGRTRVGCSSWTSEAWWGKVYPEGLPDADRLSWYARFWDAVEVDSSYYRDPGAYLFRRWARVTPDRFEFTVKFPRQLLDPKRPVDTESVGAFLSNARGLGNKLAAVLLQFPPWVKPGRAGSFLTELLGRLERGPRYAVELRDAGWFSGSELERLKASLSDRQVALAWSYLTYLDVPPVRTSDFVYLRFIGDHTTIPATQHGEVRVDRSAAIRTWAGHLTASPEEVTAAFAFFNNHFAGFAPASVNEFRAALGLPAVRFSPAVRTTLDV